MRRLTKTRRLVRFVQRQRAGWRRWAWWWWPQAWWSPAPSKPRAMCKGYFADPRNDGPSWKCEGSSSLWPEMEFKRKNFLTRRIMVPALLMIFMSCKPGAEDVMETWIRVYQRGWLRCRTEWLPQGRWHSCGPWGTWQNVISSNLSTPQKLTSTSLGRGSA